MEGDEMKISPRENRVYPKRWLVLTGLGLLNFCGALNWLTFSTVPYSAAEFYGTGLGAINLLSLIFMFSAIPVGGSATFLIERYGLRPAFLFCGWTTCIGSILRIFSVIEGLGQQGQIAFLFLGQCIIAIGQPFSTYCPAKTAEAWFAEKERTVANLIGTVANPVGVVVVGLISPLFENSDFKLNTLNLLITMAVPSALTAIFVTFTMTSSTPPSPPSAAASKETVEGKQILRNIKTILCNYKYLILLLAVGGSLGIYSSFVTLIAQILCPYGYTTDIAGLCSAILTITGVVGGIPIGRYVDHSQNFSTVLKISYGVVVGGMAIFTGVFHYYMGYLVLILIAGFGLFSFAILPVGMELAAEVTYPVGVATSSGLIVLSGQVQSMILVLVMQSLSFPLKQSETCEYNSVCVATNCTSGTSGTSETAFTTTTPIDDPLTDTFDLTHSIYFSTCWLAAIFATLLFFKPEYKRREAETRHLMTSSANDDNL